MSGSGVSRASNRSKPRQRSKQEKRDPAPQEDPVDMPRQSGVASSLDSIQVTPRTPRMLRNVSMDEVELTLLDEEERTRAANGFGHGDGTPTTPKGKRPLTAQDKREMVLLSVLCEPLLNRSCRDHPCSLTSTVQISYKVFQ
jgi:hypothetical protein